MNLLINSLKHSKKGDVILHVKYLVNSQIIYFKISDMGVGINSL